MYARPVPSAILKEATPFESKRIPLPKGTFGWVTGGFIGIASSPAFFGNEFIKPMDVFFVYLAGRVCP